MLTYILFVIGFVLLISGANILVEGSASIAKKLNISSIVIGLTIVAFGTSAPEFIVNIFALKLVITLVILFPRGMYPRIQIYLNASKVTQKNFNTCQVYGAKLSETIIQQHDMMLPLYNSGPGYFSFVNSDGATHLSTQDQ